MNDEVVDYVIVYKDAAGEWRWRAMANNHKEVAASGEGYKDESYASSIAKKLFPNVDVGVIES